MRPRHSDGKALTPTGRLEKRRLLGYDVWRTSGRIRSRAVAIQAVKGVTREAVRQTEAHSNSTQLLAYWPLEQ